jgi:hypothetical protein
MLYVCKLAVQQDSYALEHVRNQTDARKTSSMFYVCKFVIQKNGLALNYIRNPTEEMIEIALRKNIHAIKEYKYETINKYKHMQEKKRNNMKIY